MKLLKHIRLWVLVSLAWLFFWIAGLPEYYQEYSVTFMFIVDLVILPSIWFINQSKQGLACRRQETGPRITHR